MNEEERCNTTLGLGIGVGMKCEKQSKENKKGFWLNLSLPIHPKIEAIDHDHKINDDEKDDHDSISSKTNDDQEEEETISLKRSVSNANVVSNNGDGSRKKLKLTTEQTTLLEDSFKVHSTLNTGQKQELARKLNLLPRQIEVWFQNRRARTKLKHIEQECELLKKCCETLNEENCRLKKELQEVRCCSLKIDNHHHHQQQQPQRLLPFYIRYPTTATMHHLPCEKIGRSIRHEELKTVAVMNGGNVVQMNDSDSNKKNASDDI
ncbi:homeobox-leucine zipper protein HAT14-like [Rutidosis leptorrhynchoides]|uniref:homeobox-leucine zipper protein HAT14-like n=1 Tax=Rutidosis leptorrhynchoides TaxID=125765 RepID=UPI003A9A5F5F